MFDTDIRFMVESEEKMIFEECASARKETLSQWIRGRLREAAGKESVSRPVSPPPAVQKSNTYFDQEKQIWRLRGSAPCEMCGKLVLPTSEYGGNPVAGWYHQECFDKENG